jgi:hypothetical protein
MQAAPFSPGPITAGVRVFGSPLGLSHNLPGPFTTEVSANITP